MTEEKKYIFKPEQLSEEMLQHRAMVSTVAFCSLLADPELQLSMFVSSQLSHLESKYKNVIH